MNTTAPPPSLEHILSQLQALGPEVLDVLTEEKKRINAALANVRDRMVEVREQMTAVQLQFDSLCAEAMHHIQIFTLLHWIGIQEEGRRAGAGAGAGAGADAAPKTTKHKKLTWRQQILAVFESQPGAQLSFAEIAKALHVPKRKRASLRAALGTNTRTGVLLLVGPARFQAIAR